MIELAAGLCAVVGVTLVGLLTWTTVKLHKTRLAYAACNRARAEALAVLDTVPLAAFRWPAGRDPEGYSVQTIAYPKFLGELAPGDATQLEAARQALHQDGVPFALPVRLCGGGVFVIEGRRARRPSGSVPHPAAFSRPPFGANSRPSASTKSRVASRALAYALLQSTRAQSRSRRQIGTEIASIISRRLAASSSACRASAAVSPNMPISAPSNVIACSSSPR